MLDDTDYQLYRAGNGDPYEDYYGITHVNWNSELIWTDRYNNRFSWGVNTAPTGLPGTAYGGVGPTQQQVDAYAMNNGRYPITGYEASGDPDSRQCFRIQQGRRTAKIRVGISGKRMEQL